MPFLSRHKNRALYQMQENKCNAKMLSASLLENKKIYQDNNAYGSKHLW